MKRYKEKIRRFCTVLLALMLCVTFMPAGAFANDEGDLQDSDVTVETAVEDQEADAEEPVVEEPEAEEPVIEEPAAEEPVREDPVTEEPVREAPSKKAAAKEPTRAEGDEECPPHSPKVIPAQKASCVKEGNKEYYQCTKCGEKFLDEECQQEITDDSQIIIPIDPDAHKWDKGTITKKPTSRVKGVKKYTCTLCKATKTESVKYKPSTGTSFKLDGIQVKFKKAVVKKPEGYYKRITPGRVWIKGQKKSMKIYWKNASNMDPVRDKAVKTAGVIILRKTGSSKVYEEVKRVAFKKTKDGQAETNIKTSCTDTTAKKKNTEYTYRVITYYVLNGYTYISNISKNDWAKGQTSSSKLKNVYSAKINKKNAKLQSKGTTTLKLTISSPKTKFKPSSRRWSSSNKTVATVNSKGKVTAKAPGTATIRCRLVSGYEITSKITVRGAFKPKAPKLKVDYATTSSITLIWNKVKYATSYDIYKSDDGLHWDKSPVNTKKTTYTFKNLKKGHRYTFYVIARNDHKGVDKSGKDKTYHAYSDNSNVLNQKAVVKRRPMTLTGWPTNKSPMSGTTLTVTIKVNPPLGRKATLQMKNGKKWVNKKTITLPDGSSQKTVNITFPNTWWSSTTEWRLVIPATVTTSGYTSGILKITSQRRYQNPSGYVQIKDTISKHGYSHYVSPVLVNGTSTKGDHIEALIRTARKYLGDNYVQSRSGAPGYGIDESGLVMQSCYGAGVDLWPVSPSTRPYNCVPNIMSSKLRKIKFVEPEDPNDDNYTTMTRGDLIFFSDVKKGTPIHVAIYTGWGGIIHADPIKGKVNTSTIRTLEDQEGAYKYYVVGVRRIFN